MEITKNNLSFAVTGSFSEKWFDNKHFQDWEKNTFHILDHYADSTLNYIDVGAWIGPTVLYAAQRFNKVIAIEPDRLAFHRLVKNLSVNNFKNIIPVNKCLSYNDDFTSFGGNGKWGNSESTMLVSNNEYSSWEGRWSKEEREKNIEVVETIKIETLMTMCNMDSVGFIKMDIEGGEMVVIPAMTEFLKINKPILYLSLHFCFLKLNHIQSILDILFDIYDNCCFFDDEGNKTNISKETILAYKVSSVVFI